MKSHFPGMDPYLERPNLWKELHTDLISGIRKFLTPLLFPHYRVAIEQNTYITSSPIKRKQVGIPDVLLVSPKYPPPMSMGGTAIAIAPTVTTTIAPTIDPLTIKIPMPKETIHRLLEIRSVGTKEVVTVIEILSPVNKVNREGRKMYMKKRRKILGSWTHLVEIDLLRVGNPMPMDTNQENHYRTLISRHDDRPYAKVYLFSVRDHIPDIPIPLLEGDSEPMLKLNDILHEAYINGGYILDIDYNQQPSPPLDDEDWAWAKQVLGASKLALT